MNAIARAYRRPHSRTRRDGKWIATRLLGFPLIAAFGVITVIGMTQPEVLSTEYVNGIEVVTEGHGQ